MKTLAFGDLMEGCSAVFQGETVEDVLQQAGPHAVTVHGLEVTPEIIEMVKGAIKDVDA